jgi:nucleotide-binding universal stress UspA family protein
LESATIAGKVIPGGAKEGDKGLEGGVLGWRSQPRRERNDAHMIVVGSHGESPVKGAIVGSTAYKLVHFSETPVLVVRP